MYILKSRKYFQKKFKKLIAQNDSLEIKILAVFDKLAENPFYISLNTHKVNSKLAGSQIYSSRINKDLRILWDFNQEEIIVIDLIDIGGHSGNNAVY
jgi:mRNA-degrading endonuclease YafQ of YafQ-DinJ toxin-antitoxin module